MENESLKKYPLSIKYEQIGSSILRSLVGTIPVIGGALTEGLTNYWSSVKQERLNRFVESLHKYFETLKGDEIDKEFVKSEDFAQLFQLTIRKVTENKSHEKLEYFKNILINNIKLGQISDYSEIYLNLVAELHPKQIEILLAYRNIAENFRAPEFKGENDSQELIDRVRKFKDDPFTYDLLSKGLLEQHTTESLIKWKVFVVSNYGLELLKYIESE